MSAHERLLDAARALDPVRPVASFAQALYVEPPDGGAHETIARWFRRDPVAHLLALGGIGSGKTTELLAARDTLERENLSHAWHIELDAYFELSPPREGMLVTLAGLAMLAVLERAGAHIDALLHPLAVALHQPLRARRGSAPTLVRKGYLDRTQSGTARTAGSLAESIAPLVDRWRALEGARNHITLLIDSMDRRREVDALLAMTHEDLPILRDFKVGVVIVGNLGWRTELGAEQQAYFHHVWSQPAHNPARERDASFLGEVVERRAPGLFEAPSVRRVVEASGGVMRDLLTLARQAVYEAMDDHAERVAITHAEHAIDAHRNGCLDGIDSPQRETLLRMERDGTMPSPEVLAELREQGCVVEHDGVWEVHPAVRARTPRDVAA